MRSGRAAPIEPARNERASPIRTDPQANILHLVQRVDELQHQAARACTPEVERIIHTRSRDAREIEHTLDLLLDCACVPEGLTLFKTSCRYYYAIDPAAVAFYVHSYRELWGEDAGQNA